MNLRAHLVLPTCFALCCAVNVGEVSAQERPLTRLPDKVYPNTSRNIETSAKTGIALGETKQTDTPPIVRVTADEVRYENGILITGAQENPVRVESDGVRITAQKVWLDIKNKKLRASGQVVIERDAVISRRRLQNAILPTASQSENFTQTLRGENFQYDFIAGAGQLNAVTLRLPDFDIEAGSLIINDEIYVARNVLVRLGGGSEEERRIYGTPPFNLRASSLSFDANRKGQHGSIAAKGAALYFKNTKILPVPSYIFNKAKPFGRREQKSYTLTPRIATNSADGVLLTTEFEFPLKRNDPDRYSLVADIGLSARVFFRGGLELNARSRYGDLQLRGRLNDLVNTQLTNRLEVTRAPELIYTSPILPLFNLPGGRRAGVYVEAGTGRFTERLTGLGTRITSTRNLAQIGFTTRAVEKDGPYFGLFARAADYSLLNSTYRNTGFEVGYIGSLGSRLRGQVSYTDINLSGATPFLFDRVEIPRELRTTFDIRVHPRYIVPIDLRYDLDLDDFRDKRIGLLRAYKTFAYGVSYQTARRELKLDFRQGF